MKGNKKKMLTHTELNNRRKKKSTYLIIQAEHQDREKKNYFSRRIDTRETFCKSFEKEND
jgi:hypothetical protein